MHALTEADLHETETVVYLKPILLFVVCSCDRWAHSRQEGPETGEDPGPCHHRVDYNGPVGPFYITLHTCVLAVC